MKLEYVTIYVSNLDRSIEFYKELFELKEVNRISPNEKMKIVFFHDVEENTIELIERVGVPFKHDNNAMIVFSTNQFDEKMEWIKSKNIGFENGPTENYIFLNDPDGFRIGLKSSN